MPIGRAWGPRNCPTTQSSSARPSGGLKYQLRNRKNTVRFREKWYSVTHTFNIEGFIEDGLRRPPQQEAPGASP